MTDGPRVIADLSDATPDAAIEPSTPARARSADGGWRPRDEAARRPPLLCFSHLRWDFVVQRPQHLMRRFARERAVFFWEEHIPCDHHLPYLEHHAFPEDGIVALRPRLPHRWSEAEREAGLKDLLDNFARTCLAQPPVRWFYTPLMLPFARHLSCAATVHDCMDELANFAFADGRMLALETELLAAADVVFTGGQSLYEAKRHRHDDIHAFPSAVDASHFAAARNLPREPLAGRCPRLGFFGVVDERIDLDLLAALAKARPEWTIEIVGPVVKIEPERLPQKRPTSIGWAAGPMPSCPPSSAPGTSP